MQEQKKILKDLNEMNERLKQKMEESIRDLQSRLERMVT